MVFTFAFPVVFLFLFASIFRDDVAGAGITASQLYVPAMMAAGIMSTSFIGESTVKTYLLRVFGKLGVDDRTAAVTSALRHGLLE
ncbi:putative transcriptional regulatory protein NarL [Streptomyces chartreusis NRRL 3882]|uniref:Putative transcriptional regulatory protein NarL n=1 Tax=Streptomyces chartreusis NRRL 3882 TaxID=1079985 RepID=A0A2N9BIG9_STRCX|nr:putative transcriptional regulatory protein NarL [Streptomyces chartreusis NRRL 3882]